MARATVSVHAPHRLRIRASNPITGTELADLGSNAEEVWFWGQGGQGVVRASYDELPEFLNRMQIPFEPEWFMEVLGVVPIDPEHYETVRNTPNAGYVDLVADRSAPNGEPVRRVIRVDTCYGRVLQHRVERIDGTTIAVAHLDNYDTDVSGRYELPGLIKLEWPQTNTEMTLRMKRIQTNPDRLASSNWTVPRKPGYAQLRIGDAPGIIPEFPGEPHTGEILPIGDSQGDDRGVRLMHPILSEGAPPAGYFEEASRLSLDPLRPGQASEPRPFP